jgi:hypothetical protein
MEFDELTYPRPQAYGRAIRFRSESQEQGVSRAIHGRAARAVRERCLISTGAYTLTLEIGAQCSGISDAACRRRVGGGAVLPCVAGVRLLVRDQVPRARRVPAQILTAAVIQLPTSNFRLPRRSGLEVGSCPPPRHVMMPLFRGLAEARAWIATRRGGAVGSRHQARFTTLRKDSPSSPRRHPPRAGAARRY